MVRDNNARLKAPRKADDGERRDGATLDLISELVFAQGAVAPNHRDQLARAGVPSIIIESGLVGIGAISLTGETLYEPAEGGAVAVIVAVRVADPFTPECIDSEIVPFYGTIVDLVATSLRDPDRWRLRRGAAAWLGACAAQYLDPPPVSIKRSPLSWLRAGATGLCVLDRDPLAIWRTLSICRAIEAEDRDHARQLLRALERPFPIPTITVRAAPRRAEASHG